ncbi:glycine receptor subunit alpha-2-like [Mercenaria mercenaria]|uniref:glycine receptor subunit alpha-2-like n=1 Tax=Mercenaria mercenaria TaxID=6596 RepID=UPI00234EF374|nr:glycine receptor subunit alpha-2-like [Mercenaria mercenaria]
MRCIIPAAVIFILNIKNFVCAHAKHPRSTSEFKSLDLMSQHKSERQQTLDGLLSNYDPRIPPNYEEDFPVTVLVQLHITNIDSISESNMDYSIGMFLRQTWNDSRLAYKKIPELRSLELDSRLISSIWVPDLFITNEKKAQFHTVTVPNKLMHIYPEGRVQYSIRISATLHCNMDLRKYPLDSQTCYVMMESYGYSTDILEFRWNPSPVSRDTRLALAQFDLGEMKRFQCDKEYISVTYTCIMLELKLTRQFGYYITQIYIPSMLIVILSWVSFWLDKEAVPARISLGLLTVLTMTTQSSGARASLPKVSYVKGIDVWMATCLLFVFAALIEFAFVNVHTRVEKRRQQKTIPENEKMQNVKDAGNEKTELDEKEHSRFQMFMPGREVAHTCDRISRLVFPLVFLLFNIIHWCVYTLWIPNSTTIS